MNCKALFLDHRHQKDMPNPCAFSIGHSRKLALAFHVPLGANSQTASRAQFHKANPFHYFASFHFPHTALFHIGLLKAVYQLFLILDFRSKFAIINFNLIFRITIFADLFLGHLILPKMEFHSNS
jgi:hypothetical protein